MRQVPQYTINQFFNTFSILNSSFSPDERSILYTTSQTGIFNAFAIPVRGGAPRQLTTSTTIATYAISYFPHDERILFVRDNCGDENHHLYILEDKTTERDLTPGIGVKAKFLGWSRDGKHFYYETNERDRRFFDIYQMNVSSLDRTLVFRDTEGFKFHSVSPDENYVVFGKNVTRAGCDIYLFSIQTGEMKHLTPHEGEVVFRPASFDIDSQALYYLTDEESEFTYVARMEFSTGKQSVVLKWPGNVFAYALSKNGKYNILLIDVEGQKKIKIHEHQTGEQIALPSFPKGDVSSAVISPSERLMAFYVNGDRSPNMLYVYEFDTGKSRKLVDTLNPEIDSDDLVESRSVSYQSFDGLKIPAFLWKPHQGSAERKVPALIWLHGGPGGQTRKGYSPRIQYLVNHGYAVLGVNYRGSSGYGKTFQAADERKHGREPLWDCVEAKKFLASLDFIDASKIGVIGASFGGYMVLAALAFTPEEFACGVDLFGISNWVRMIESFPAYWASQLDFYYKKMGHPVTDRDLLYALSPAFHADRIIKPLMVVQGANDPRVLRIEADEIVEEIRKKSGTVEYLLFLDEGHGLTKKSNRIIAYDSILKFLDKHLRGEGAYVPYNEKHPEDLEEPLPQKSSSHKEAQKAQNGFY
jgi:dipeptidyl aminopeptidase/acylaminoacyl peptidase